MSAMGHTAAVAVFAVGCLAMPAAAEPLPITSFVLMPGDKAQVDEFKARLQRVPFFAQASDDNGSNLMLVVSVAQVPTTGGSAASGVTGLLAASTLGIIPTVENKDISVVYVLRANTVRIASFNYTSNFTSVSNLFGQFGQLPADARQWVLQSVDTLEKDLQASAALAALQAEYDGYFGKK